MVHLSLPEPLTGSSLSRGKTKVKRLGVNSGLTAYISLALQPSCPLLRPAEVQLSNYYDYDYLYYIYTSNSNEDIC